MKFAYTILTTLLALNAVIFPVFVSAEPLTNDLTSYGTLRFNNENWNALPHPKVATFTVHEDGSVLGLTENGIYFVQYNVPNEYGVRVQRFEIEDHYHYIVEGEIADSLAELSALLAAAYEQSIT